MAKKKVSRTMKTFNNKSSAVLHRHQVNVRISTFLKDMFKQDQSTTERITTAERLWTALALIVCMTIAGVFVKRAWDRFSRSPIVVNVETTNYPLYKLTFPAVTVCPANNIKKTVGEKLLARYLNVSLTSELQEEFWNVMSALSKCQYPFYFRMQDHLKPIFKHLSEYKDFNISDFMLQVLPTCSELFGSCFWLGNEVNCCDVFNLQRTESGFCYSFNSLTSDEAWNCNALDDFSQFSTRHKEKNESKDCEPRHNIASGTTTGFEVFLLYSNPEESLGKGQRDRAGARVYIHHPNQFPEAGTGVLMPEEQKKVFRVEVTPSVTESSSAVRALSISQRYCLFPDEMKLSVFHTYTQQNCLMECRLENVANMCGCYPYFFRDVTVGDVPECDLQQLWCLSNHNVELRIFKPPKGARGFKNLTSIDCSKCLPTCHNSRYSLDYSYSDDGNPYAIDRGGYLDVYYKDLSAIKYHQKLAFDFMDLIVSFGGVVSLFLGVSLLSVFQSLCRCTKRCATFYRNMQLRHINTQIQIYKHAWTK